MAFTFPSSSAPSTPESRRGQSRSNLFANDPNNGPSTTPAGPPPSSAASFTPADPPPSTVFGSSQLGSQRSLFSSKSSKASRKDQGLFGANGSASKPIPPFGADRNLASTAQKRNGKLKTQTFQIPLQDDPDDADASGEDGEPELPAMTGDHGSDDDMEMGGDIWQEQAMTQQTDGSRPYEWARESDLLGMSPQPALPKSSKQPRPGVGNSVRTRHMASLAASRRQKSVIPAIASDTAKQLGLPDLHEPDVLVLETEDQIMKIYPEDSHLTDKDELLEAALRVVPDTLARLWQRCSNESRGHTFSRQEYVVGIGPAEDCPSFHKAAFVANLLLRLHHPPLSKSRQAFTALRSNRPTIGSSFQVSETRFTEPYPKLLFDWLEESHFPFRNVIASLKTYQPNPTAHPNFWDFVLSLTLRGKLNEALMLLNEADFTKASTAADDKMGDRGYSGEGLQMVLRQVNKAMQVLRSCPIVADDDYDTTGFAWVTFRARVEEAKRFLHAATEDEDEEPIGSAFGSSAITLASSVSDVLRSSKKAHKKYPRAIYRPLQEFYGVLLGGSEELLAASQDWIEASVALTAWWDGEDADIAPGSVASRPSMRLIDSNLGAAYLDRLALAFDRVTGDVSGKDDTLQIDSSNQIEVALAAVFEGDVEEVLCLLRAWSVPIASAVTEVACQGGWFESAPSSIGAAGLNQEDMMVLSYGQQEERLKRDDLLLLYADMLSEVTELHDQGGEAKEGWAVAVEVLNRLDNTKVGEQRIGELMGRLKVDSDERADSLIHASRTFGLDEQAHKIAERYGDFVAETTSSYGTAIVYYARAHNTKKVKDVLDLLISYCLVESRAFPPADDLDDHLSYLLDRPKDTLQHLRRNDPVAADILSLTMSGYATLRKFYELRDDGLAGGESAGLRPIARKAAAAAALVAVVSSSADAIRGGLYDRDSEAVVSVDGLLVLLGEATALVDQPTRYLALPQLLVLLRAIEDLQTVHTRIREQCDECLKAALAGFRGGAASLPEPQDLLKKSVSNLSASTGFSLLGSVMAERASEKSKGRRDEVKRGWDWREGLKVEQGGSDIVSMLRLGLAREVARAWLDGEEL